MLHLQSGGSEGHINQLLPKTNTHKPLNVEVLGSRAYRTIAVQDCTSGMQQRYGAAGRSGNRTPAEGRNR